MSSPDVNPFKFSGSLAPEDMIDRDTEAEDLLALTRGLHWFRLVGPRRYGKTTLLRRVLAAAERDEVVTVLVDLQDVLSISEIVVRLERGYKKLKGPVRRHIDDLLRAWNIGVSLGGGGFTATLRQNPDLDSESVLLRLLEMPDALFERNGTTSFIVFDEFQDVLAVKGADGKIRSVIQHQGDAATYAFAGSEPGMMSQLFADPSRPLMSQAIQRQLDPLPLNQVANYVTTRFQLTGRDPGTALDAMLEFTRGHPQRSMMLAHYLWHRTPHGETADESTWIAALDQVSRDESQLMYAAWAAMKPNERRLARALATTSGSIWSEETAALVGLNRSSVGRTLRQLEDTADVIEFNGRPRLTDPVFERWLATRGVLPDDDSDAND